MSVKSYAVCVTMCCRTYGYVEYETQEMAAKAVALMNNFSLHGSNLQVSWVSIVWNGVLLSLSHPPLPRVDNV